MEIPPEANLDYRQHERTGNSGEPQKGSEWQDGDDSLGTKGDGPRVVHHDPPGNSWQGQKMASLGASLRAALQQSLKETHSKTPTTVKDLFPLPLSATSLVEPEKQDWMWCILVCLNDLNGGGLDTERAPAAFQKRVVLSLQGRLDGFWEWDEPIPLAGFGDLFDVKGVDYRGEEVKLAKPFSWESIAPTFPKEVGSLRLEDFCRGGCLHYVQNFEDYLLPIEQQHLGRVPRVMVAPDDWFGVCEGLLNSGICGLSSRADLYHVGPTPLLNGLFSVSKNEYIGTLELGRLIMNLVPLNQLCRSFQGDVATLPTVAGFSSFYLEEGEVAILASEDIKCFYYLFTVPLAWHRFLGFAGEVPESLKPPHLKGVPTHLVARVLPMGFLNSVGLAQHIHRNVVRWCAPYVPSGTGAERELRRDRPGTISSEAFRVYLDNWDAVCKVDQHLVDDVLGTPTAHQLALRQQYAQLSLPRHPKKAVESATKAEIQGAIFDGVKGVAFAKPAKVAKYFGLAWQLVQQQTATLKEIQVVTGGLVYISLFRRPCWAG